MALKGPAFHKAHLAVLTANLLFGINFSVVKWIAPALIQPFGLNFLRVSSAVVLFWSLYLLKPSGVAYRPSRYSPVFTLCPHGCCHQSVTLHQRAYAYNSGSCGFIDIGDSRIHSPHCPCTETRKGYHRKDGRFCVGNHRRFPAHFIQRANGHCREYAVGRFTGNGQCRFLCVLFCVGETTHAQVFRLARNQMGVHVRIADGHSFLYRGSVYGALVGFSAGTCCGPALRLVGGNFFCLFVHRLRVAAFKSIGHGVLYLFTTAFFRDHLLPVFPGSLNVQQTVVGCLHLCGSVSGQLP